MIISSTDCLMTETLLFVWEQYLIINYLSDFSQELLAVIAAGIIAALSEPLLQSHSVCFESTTCITHIRLIFSFLGVRDRGNSPNKN